MYATQNAKTKNGTGMSSWSRRKIGGFGLIISCCPVPFNIMK